MIGDEDLVHQEGHHRADGHHDDRGDADGVDTADDPPVGAEGAKAQTDVGVFLHVKVDRQGAAAALADDGGDGGTGHPHLKHEDEHRVEDDVDDGACPLRNHGVDAPSGTLQQPLEHDLTEQGKGAAGDDLQIAVAHVNDVLLIGLEGEQRIAEGKSQHSGNHKPYKGQKHAVDGHLVGPVLLSGAQCAAHQRVDADGRTGAQTDHKLLGGERQRNGGQCVLTDHGHEHTVHHIVKRLHQHGRDDGQGHIPNQFANGHDAQLVFLHLLRLPFIS